MVRSTGRCRVTLPIPPRGPSDFTSPPGRTIFASAAASRTRIESCRPRLTYSTAPIAARAFAATSSDRSAPSAGAPRARIRTASPSTCIRRERGRVDVPIFSSDVLTFWSCCATSKRWKNFAVLPPADEKSMDANRRRPRAPWHRFARSVARYRSARNRRENARAPAPRSGRTPPANTRGVHVFPWGCPRGAPSSRSRLQA